MKNCSGMSCWSSPWTLWRLCKQHCKQLSIRFWPSACKGKPTIKTGCKTRENSSTECHKSPERRNSSSTVQASSADVMAEVSAAPSARFPPGCPRQEGSSPWEPGTGRLGTASRPAQRQAGGAFQINLLLQTPPVLHEPSPGPHQGWVSSG